MDIRPMLSQDKHAVFVAATRLAEQMYPLLRMDIRKVSYELDKIGQYEYAKVVTDHHGEAQGCLIARTAPNLWAQRNHAAILLWYSHIPGGGIALLRDFRRWVQSSRKIRVAGFSHDTEKMCPSMLKLAERAGFEKRGGGAYLLYN